MSHFKCPCGFGSHQLAALIEHRAAAHPEKLQAAREIQEAGMQVKQ